MNKNPLQDILDRSRQHRKENSKIDDPAWVNRTLGVRNAFKEKPKEDFVERGKKISESKYNNDHPTRGKKLPKEWTEAMSKGLKGHVKKDTSKMGKKNKKPLMTPDGPFDSTKSATEHFGYKWAENCTNKIKKGHPGWYWITVEEYVMLTGKDI
jgi:hypothetical protein